MIEILSICFALVIVSTAVCTRLIVRRTAYNEGYGDGLNAAIRKIKPDLIAAKYLGYVQGKAEAQSESRIARN